MQAHLSKPCPSFAGVLAYPRRHDASEHEVATQAAIALRISALLGVPLADQARPSRAAPDKPLYYVPDRTLVGLRRAAVMGIHGPDHLYGGVVPHGFVATKAITHGLPASSARAPRGWAAGLSERLEGLTLPGYTVFCKEDALLAGRRLLQRGPLRLKPVAATAGRGQVLARDEAQLRIALGRQCERGVARIGLVLEENLVEVATYSVGWLRVAGLEASYVGRQSLTRDNQGQRVYGGSRLRCARGGMAALAALPDLTEDEQTAITLARRYDEAVWRAYPDILASRRNYDIAFGHNEAGDPRAGVLEQSWRSGGASMAELAALQALLLSPGRSTVWAETRERYGEQEPEPASERCIYRGRDRRVGFITKSGGIVEDADGNP